MGFAVALSLIPRPVIPIQIPIQLPMGRSQRNLKFMKNLDSWIGRGPIPTLNFAQRRRCESGRRQEGKEITAFAVGVAHVVCGPFAVVVGMSRGRVDGDVLSPVDL